MAQDRENKGHSQFRQFVPHSYNKTPPNGKYKFISANLCSELVHYRQPALHTWKEREIGSRPAHVSANHENRVFNYAAALSSSVVNRGRSMGTTLMSESERRERWPIEWNRVEQSI
jgi:hypothetical protein